MSDSYLDDAERGEGTWRAVWQDGPDETDCVQPTAPRPPRYGLAAEGTWLAPDALPSLLPPLCAAQDALARLDARAAAAPAAIRDGLIARIAFAEAAGWLAFAHAWADPRDLALKDLGLTGSYAIATRVGRPLRDLPNTYARARRAWDDQDFEQLLAGDTAVATALTLARLLRRAVRMGENPFGDVASASASRAEGRADRRVREGDHPPCSE